ncbi:hypothetical protein GGR54DRAFT_635889 [Hypoxylon sp. NC1633]|nr:hypothetical protein GGR54DRAFT_635889 [Hypoxylon sp. NC1633]
MGGRNSRPYQYPRYDDSGDEHQSPPPAYSKRPPREETPLLSDHAIESKPSPSRADGRECLPYVYFFVIVPPTVVFLYACVLLYGILLLPPPFSAPPPVYSVAIVGAGPAGISAARYLHHQAVVRDIYLNITLFESAPVVGGQLAFHDSTSGPVFPYDDRAQDPIIAEDITGTALLWGNPLFTKESEKVLGDKVHFSELGSQKVSYFSGHGIVSQTTRPYAKTPMMDWLGLIWRYGSSVWQAGDMSKQGDIRGHFANPSLVPDVMQLGISLGILDPVQEYAQNALDSRGIGGAYVTEVLGPQVQRAHSQDIGDISTLAMTLAAFQEDSANSYAGGELIERLEHMVSATGATVRANTEVLGLKYEQINAQDSAWLIEYGAAGSPGFHAEAFDKVIIAAPNFDLYHRAAAVDDVEAASMQTYRPAHVTFFTTAERLDLNIYGDADQILFLDEQSGSHSLHGVRELAFVRRVVRAGDGGGLEYLYRVLSDNNVTEQIKQLDLEITWSYQVKLENAYPYLFPFRRFPPFKLSDKGLWWTSAIHAIASTVDMSWLAGQIVAEEVIKDLKNQSAVRKG